MSTLSFALAAVLLISFALFFTNPFREQVCAPLVRWWIGRRRDAAARAFGNRG